MKNTVSHLLFGYWSGLQCKTRQGGGADEERVILKYLAPYFFILEIYPDRYPRFLPLGKIVRSAFPDWAGRSNYWEYWNRQDRTRVPALLKRAAEDGCPLFMSSRAMSREGHVVEIETLIMPVLRQDRERLLFLGAFIPDSDRSDGFEISGDQYLIRARFALDELRPHDDIVMPFVRPAHLRPV